jgi:tetratricopeptide (TPR) repeat protein
MFSAMLSKRYIVIISLLALSVWQCSRAQLTSQEPRYWAHSDTVHYVGIQTCAGCHGDIYQTYIQTGMGQSLGHANQEKSLLPGHHKPLYDEFLDLYYLPFWNGDKLAVREFRLSSNGDTLHNLLMQADFVIGSGQHTNSHLMWVNGYLTQMPFTWYAQEGRLDFPPGYEGGFNSRFERKIGLECLSCHNAMPTEFHIGSENKYSQIATGIDCERCHGPGSAHVKKIMSGDLTDTSKYIDYSIVNPKKLSPQLQFEICSRCHLQGNAVTDSGKSFLDFVPGMYLHNVMDIYLPRYEGGAHDFIMASHVDRFKLSKCFQMSDGQFVCTSCHNPHISRKVTGKEVFDATCKSCHGGVGQTNCSAPMKERLDAGDYCNGCHMPKSGSIDIPHVTVHDHYIRKPDQKQMQEADQIKKFLGLVSVNNPNPSMRSRIRGYLQQFEKFAGAAYMLDSAALLLHRAAQPGRYFHEWIQLWYLQEDYPQIAQFVRQMQPDAILSQRLVRQEPDNEHAWTAYRIGEAFQFEGRREAALPFFYRAIELAPYQLEFFNKLGVNLLALGRLEEAREKLSYAVKENPLFAEAHANLGFLFLQTRDYESAEYHLLKALQLRPDYPQALGNLGVLYLQINKKQQARKVLEKLVRLDPTNFEAQRALQMARES